MTYMILGASGFMGREVRKVLSVKHPDIGQVLIDVNPQEDGMLKDPFLCKERPDCIIDFSHHSATNVITEYAKTFSVPVVIATTGQTDTELESIKRVSSFVPVFFSANMSVGVAVLIHLAKEAAAAFPDADIEIVETHHNRKLDVPSGTALSIAEAIREVRPDSELNVGRHENGKRPDNQIGIHSLRMGNITGIHEIHICTASQTLTLKHEAHNRSLFAEGAVKAAEFLLKKPSGLYNMNDLLKG